MDGQVTWESWDTWTSVGFGCPTWDNPRMSSLLGTPEILGQRGVYMAVHRGIIPKWPGYFGIPGYLDKGGI